MLPEKKMTSSLQNKISKRGFEKKNKQKLWKNLAKSGQVRIINKIPESIGGRKERTMNEWINGF